MLPGLEKAVNIQTPETGKYECGLLQFFGGGGPILSLFRTRRRLRDQKRDRKIFFVSC